MAEPTKTITILGSTGSIGYQAVDVLNSLNSNFRLGFLTINTRIDLLEEQLKHLNPIGVAIGNEEACRNFKKNTGFKGKILCGEEGVCEAAAYEENDLVLSGLVGFAGVMPAISAIEAGNNIALANKEALVSAGSIITMSAKKNNAEIIAVDSEHSAVLQCLIGESLDEIEKIILTASGGPFRNTPIDQFESLTVVDALDHPNWNMGNKITIDSATMMNKGFEVIEAHWLFGLNADKIEVLIHPQSIVHSLVQFIDGSIKAQLGLPDMRIPIAYALNFPRRLKYDFPRLNLSEIRNLEFYQPDLNQYPCLGLGYSALKSGGIIPAALNAANEIAVNAFLEEKIKFTDIFKIIDNTLTQINNIANPSLHDIIDADIESRNLTRNYINKLY